MARQSRSRPAARPAPKAAPAQQSRGAHTQAGVPARTAPAGVPATQGAAAPAAPSMFAGIAQTAAGVALGSTMGHGLSSMLFGGSSSAATEAPAAAAPQSSFESERRSGASCEIQSKDFTQCLNATSNDMTACSYYLDQLKACQSMASQY